MRKAVACLIIAGLIAPAMSDTLGNVYDGSTTSISIAQNFGPYAPDNLDIWVVSDFATTTDYYLYDVFTEGRTTVGRDAEGAFFDIYDALPWENGNIVMSATDGYEHLYSEGKFGATFDGQTLPAGSYYIVYQADRDFLMTGGNSLVFHTTTGNNNDWTWNPGGGHGFVSKAIEDANGYPIDVNWQLTAEPVPEPHSLLLLGVATLLVRKR